MARSEPYERKSKKAPAIWKLVEEPDWAAVINKLLRHGYRKAQIAFAADTTREWVYAMLQGRTPNWRVGQAVLKLLAYAESQ